MSDIVVSPTISAVVPDTTALGLKKRTEELEAHIKLFARIATAEEYEIVAGIGLAAARHIKEASEFYDPRTNKLYRLWKESTDERASVVKPAERVKDLAGRLTGEWEREQEQRRLEEQRRRDAIELEKAETAMLEEAAALEREGRKEEAQMLIESPVEPAPVMVNSSVPKVTGVSKPRDNWQVEITDLKALLKGIVEGKVPLQAAEGNMTWLNGTARTNHGKLNYPGIKVVNRAKASFRP